MRFKALPIALAAAALLGGVCGAWAATTAGSKSDPFVSQSFADGDYSESVLTEAFELIDSSLGGAESGSAAEGSYNFEPGGEIRLGFGGSVALISGSARLSVASGEIINVTEGAVAQSGSLKSGSRYLAAEDSSATVSFDSLSQVCLSGDVEIVSGRSACPFGDVKPADWFYADVLTAVDLGLINGMTETSFEPNGSMTNAQVIKLAACAHQKYHEGEVTLQNGSPWYSTYVDYALENGIITSEPADYNAASTRAYYIAVMYGALPESEYREINSIPDGAVPDISESDWFCDRVYTFYRAGIVTGSDEKGSFMPNSSVRRSEVATLAARLFDESARRSFELG